MSSRIEALIRRLPDRLLVGGLWLRGLALVPLLIALYYLVGMALVHRIDDRRDFAPASVPEGGSKAVAIAAALIDREINQHRWTPNDPFFLPSAALDNMPNFQLGIIHALARFGVELGDRIGRTRGSSQVDSDLETAVGLLKYPGDVWVWDLSVSWAPTASSERQYERARTALAAYNARLAEGKAVFDRRADSLQETLDRVAKDLGSSSAAIDGHIAAHAGWLPDTQADDLFYETKGRLYAYLLLMQALGEDFAAVIRERQAEAVWAQMIESLASAAALDPLVVANGSPDGSLFPNHLAAQGFYLLRARSQMYEIAAVLIK